MTAGSMVTKLVEVQEALRCGNALQVRCLLSEAQNLALEIEREGLDLLRENEHLRNTSPHASYWGQRDTRLASRSQLASTSQLASAC